MTRIERVTSPLPRECSTTEPHGRKSCTKTAVLHCRFTTVLLYYDYAANCHACADVLGAGEGNRTLVISLEGFCSTIELHPRYLQLIPRRLVLLTTTTLAHCIWLLHVPLNYVRRHTATWLSATTKRLPLFLRTSIPQLAVGTATRLSILAAEPGAAAKHTPDIANPGKPRLDSAMHSGLGTSVAQTPRPLTTVTASLPLTATTDFHPSLKNPGGGDWIRTNVGARPTDLQSAPFNHSGTPPQRIRDYGDVCFACQTMCGSFFEFSGCRIALADEQGRACGSDPASKERAPFVRTVPPPR